jgi:hypothetical protein
MPVTSTSRVSSWRPAGRSTLPPCTLLPARREHRLARPPRPGAGHRQDGPAHPAPRQGLCDPHLQRRADVLGAWAQGRQLDPQRDRRRDRDGGDLPATGGRADHGGCARPQTLPAVAEPSPRGRSPAPAPGGPTRGRGPGPRAMRSTRPPSLLEPLRLRTEPRAGRGLVAPDDRLVAGARVAVSHHSATLRAWPRSRA